MTVEKIREEQRKFVKAENRMINSLMSIKKLGRSEMKAGNITREDFKNLKDWVEDYFDTMKDLHRELNLIYIEALPGGEDFSTQSGGTKRDK